MIRKLSQEMAVNTLSYMQSHGVISPAFTSSICCRLKVSDGYGSVIMGEPRQLRQLAEYWATLKKRLAASANNSSKTFRTETDGVLLDGVVSYHRIFSCIQLIY